MQEHEFWRLPETGEAYAIELEDGIVSGCCGPLEGHEVDPQFLAGYDYSPERAAWFEEHRDELTLVDATLPQL